ncbi:cytochrome P450 [Pseudonocardia autotrophica]|uniref:Cytochrome P450 107B1 n=1 Tax=Pseudonocardia autotrophica TaxID=2074 RepID=A0A1Y2MM56_PSEAH|nr:Cytochrome P450 107B1 [Pseudonocardia autotrophica]TDN72699.1 cytochrome P450 [Pseudonocardia autotrophica]
MGGAHAGGPLRNRGEPTMTDTTEPLVLDQEFFDDPDQLYRELRAERPVTRAIGPNGVAFWMITRYADARAALNDPRLAKDARRIPELLARQESGPPARELAESLVGHMLNADPPDHTRLRKLVGRAFTMRAIGRLRPRIEQIATELADAMTASGPEVDLLDTFAFPLPMTVICEILGVPPDRREEFRTWSNTLLSAAGDSERGAAAAAMATYLSELVEDKAAHPADDMLSEIVRASEDGDSLSPGETTAMAFLLLVAGHETTVNLIGNGALALLRDPEQLALLRADPDRVPAAVEEILRYDGPVNLATFRFTTEPVEYSGTTIPADAFVLVSLLGANRDPQRWPDADRFDVERDPSGHLAFGFGIHHCVGAPLARLEGEIAFRTLLARFPDLRLAGEPGPHRMSTLIHGRTRLPVRLDAPAGAATGPAATGASATGPAAR